jgi:uncharacterized protein involved in outer membrane biogenesis
MTGSALSASAGFARRHPALIIALGVLLLVVLALALFNWNWARAPVERLVSSTTGRELQIEGDLDVDFFPLEVQAGKVRFANAGWSTEPVMVAVERIDLQAHFWPLFAGRLVLPQLHLAAPHLRLERNAVGEGNWMLVEPRDCGTDCPQRVRILRLTARDGDLEFHEPTLETFIRVHFESVDPAGGDALAPLELHGNGTFRAEPFEVAGRIDSPLALQGEALPYQLSLMVAAGNSRARVSGTLAEPLQLQDTAVNFELRGNDLADLYEFTGIVLPVTPPYALEGRLGREGRRLFYEDFSGTVGDSDMAGDVWYETGGERPRLVARLQSRRLDLDDLAGFIGGTPGTGPGEEASPEQKAEARAQKARGKLLPQRPFQLAKLRAMDADVQLDAARLTSGRLPLESMKGHLLLEDGQLTLRPLQFGAAGGSLISSVRLDARRDPARLELTMQLRRLELPRLMPRVKSMREALGRFSGVLELRGRGNSTASLLASADGEFGVIMGRGRMSNLVLELAGLDIAEALAFLVSEDQQVTLRCAYADFGIEDGVATARSVAFDTTDTALLLRGDISFRDESLDLTLVPRPKDLSPVSIRTPIRVKGTLADPDIDLKGGPLLLRGAAVAGLAAIAPPLALLALAETGPGEDTDCGRGTAAAELVPPGDLPSAQDNNGERTRADERQNRRPVPGPRSPDLR